MPISSNGRKLLIASFEAWKRYPTEHHEMGGPPTLEVSDLVTALKLTLNEANDAAQENVDLGYLEFPIQGNTSFVGVLTAGRNKAREIIEERRKRWRKIVFWVWHAVVTVVTIGVIPILVGIANHKFESLENRAATTQNIKP